MHQNQSRKLSSSCVISSTIDDVAIFCGQSNTTWCILFDDNLLLEKGEESADKKWLKYAIVLLKHVTIESDNNNGESLEQRHC